MGNENNFDHEEWDCYHACINDSIELDQMMNLESLVKFGKVCDEKPTILRILRKGLQLQSLLLAREILRVQRECYPEVTLEAVKILATHFEIPLTKHLLDILTTLNIDVSCIEQEVQRGHVDINPKLIEIMFSPQRLPENLSPLDEFLQAIETRIYLDYVAVTRWSDAELYNSKFILQLYEILKSPELMEIDGIRKVVEEAIEYCGLYLNDFLFQSGNFEDMTSLLRTHVPDSLANLVKLNLDLWRQHSDYNARDFLDELFKHRNIVRHPKIVTVVTENMKDFLNWVMDHHVYNYEERINLHLIKDVNEIWNDDRFRRALLAEIHIDPSYEWYLEAEGLLPKGVTRTLESLPKDPEVWLPDYGAYPQDIDWEVFNRAEPVFYEVAERNPRRTLEFILFVWAATDGRDDGYPLWQVTKRCAQIASISEEGIEWLHDEIDNMPSCHEYQEKWNWAWKVMDAFEEKFSPL
jgi:hypothetical protein